MRLKCISMLIIGLLISGVVGQEEAKTPGMEDGDDKDLHVSDVAPSWA